MAGGKDGVQWDGEGDGGGRAEACSPPDVSCLCRGRWDSHSEGPLSPARRGGVVTGGYGPVRPHLQAPSACRGQGYPGEGGGGCTRSIGKAATFLRSHRREAAELEFEWGGIQGRALTAAAARTESRYSALAPPHQNKGRLQATCPGGQHVPATKQPAPHRCPRSPTSRPDRPLLRPPRRRPHCLHTSASSSAAGRDGCPPR